MRLIRTLGKKMKMKNQVRLEMHNLVSERMVNSLLPEMERNVTRKIEKEREREKMKGSLADVVCGLPLRYVFLALSSLPERSLFILAYTADRSKCGR